MPKRRQHGTGALYRLPSRGLWRGVVDGGTDPTTGRRRQWTVHATTQRAARDKLEALQTQIREHGAPIDTRTTVAQWATHWLDTIATPDVAPKTREGYASLVRRWIVPTIGTRPVATLRPSDVRAVRTAMITAGRATSTIAQAHGVLSLMLDAAVAERITTHNPAADVRRPGRRRDRRPATERGALTTTQAVAILQAAAQMPTTEGLRWWFRLLTGARQSEILGAQLADLDLTAGTYRVVWQLQELRRDHGCPPTEPCDHGCSPDEPCGRKQAARCPHARWRVPDGFDHRHLTGAWHLTPPKSRRGRLIPLIPQLTKALTRHLTDTADQPNPHGLIWHDGRGRPILPRDDNAQWRDLLVSAGVITPDEAVPGGTEITGHWTRHTAVTVLASLGVDFHLIGEIVGHSSAQVTAMYRHAQEAEKRAAMDLLGGAWADALALPPGGPQIEA